MSPEDLRRMFRDNYAPDLLYRDVLTGAVRRCSACRKSYVTTGALAEPHGVISYGPTSEHHCAECCRSWERFLRADRDVQHQTTMGDFRAWQAQRARQA